MLESANRMAGPRRSSPSNRGRFIRRGNDDVSRLDSLGLKVGFNHYLNQLRKVHGWRPVEDRTCLRRIPLKSVHFSGTKVGFVDPNELFPIQSDQPKGKRPEVTHQMLLADRKE